MDSGCFPKCLKGSEDHKDKNLCLLDLQESWTIYTDLKVSGNEVRGNLQFKIREGPLKR